MRYGLDSTLPLGAFEHCGNRHIKLYGGGGSWNPVSAISSGFSSISKGVTDAFGAVGNVINQAEKLTTGIIAAVPVIGKPIAGAISAVDNALGIPNQPKTNQSLGAPSVGGPATQTISSGQAEQKPTSLNNQSVLGAPGVTGSLTTRTVSGPDNTYKMDKTTMLGL